MHAGHVLNSYHAKFGKVIGRDTLADIQAAIARGAAVSASYKGFHARNKGIATSCNRLIAFTWGEGPVPGSSGTLDTWKKCPARVQRLHISLGETDVSKKRRDVGAPECELELEHVAKRAKTATPLPSARAVSDPV